MPVIASFFLVYAGRHGCRVAQSKARRAKNGENVKQIYFTKLRRWYIMEGRALRGMDGRARMRPAGLKHERITGGSMNDNRINGNTEGIRQSALERLRELYDMEIEGDCFAPPELIERIDAVHEGRAGAEGD